MTKLGVREIRRGVAGILAGMAFAAMMWPDLGRAGGSRQHWCLVRSDWHGSCLLPRSLNSVKLAVSEINKAGGVPRASDQFNR